MSLEEQLAAVMAALPEDRNARRELELIPAGEFRMRPHDGRGPFYNRDAEAIIQRSHANAYSLVFDYDHATELNKGTGAPAPASGWIKRLFARDGAVWGEIDWTDKAAAAIDAREYRYYSPVFMHDPDGNVLAVRSAALTNDPAMFVRALSHSTGKGADMDLEKLRKALGLAATATEAEILAAATAAAGAVAALASVGKALGLEGEQTGETRTPALTAQRTGLAAIATAAGLAEGAALADIEAAVKTAKASAAGDPGQFVPRAEFDRVKQDLAALQASGAKATATAAVDKAIEDGKVTPASRDWALGYAAKDLEGFAAVVKDAPAILPNGRVAPATAAPEGGDALTADEKAVCAATGLSEEDFVKSRKALAAAGAEG